MRHKSLIRKLTAAFIAVCLTVGSAGPLPVTVYGDNEETDSTHFTSTDSHGFDIDERVAELIAQGDYEEGSAVVLYDTESPASDEELVGAGDLIRRAEQIAEVSAESYVNATGETLPIPDEELVGGSQDSTDDDRIAVLIVENQNRSTEELLWELLSDPRVLSAEPDYIFSIDAVESEELPGNAPVMHDTESSAVSGMESFHQNPSVMIPEEESTDQDGDTEYDVDDETVKPDAADLSEGDDASFRAADTAIDTPSDTSENPEIAAGPDTEDALSVSSTDGANIDGLGSEDQSTDILVSDIPEGEISLGASADLTPYQWGMADGSNRYTQTLLENAAVYSVHSPYWNTVGATNSEGVIAVIDTGIDHTHPDLKDNMYVIPDSLRKKLGCGKYGISTSGLSQSYLH